MADNRFSKLTPDEEDVLRFAESERAIRCSQVEDALGYNERRAAKCMKDLLALGLLSHLRVGRYALNDAGQAWLDSHPRFL